ncbi:MAG: histidine phosphatase family protein [Ignavibacteriae bacterium]|nr:histidine phosphatase family protein [Ignavibacteriota bacterium]
MKTLYLMRHSKSSWENRLLSDFERPLNERGLRDAPFMGNILSKLISTPQIVFSSPAQRAISTAEVIAQSLNFDLQKIIKDEKIYHAVVSDIMRIVYTVDDNIESIMIFGHNPTFTQVSNYLSDKIIDNIPTSGFVKIDFDLNSWKNIEGKTGKLVLFEYPKKYLKSKN